MGFLIFGRFWGAQRVKNIGNEEYRTRTERQNRFQTIFRRILEVLWLQGVPQVKKFESRKIEKSGKSYFLDSENPDKFGRTRDRERPLCFII